MLLGIIIGLLLALLTFGNLYFLGMRQTYVKQVKTATTELYDAQVMLGKFVTLEQERQKIKEQISINFTDAQITTLADRIGARVQTIMESAQADALKKMN